MITEAPQFFTSTILEWKRLLKPDKYQRMISISAVGEAIAPRPTLNTNCGEFVAGRSEKNINKGNKAVLRQLMTLTLQILICSFIDFFTMIDAF
jgi:hypothetical protein